LRCQLYLALRDDEGQVRCLDDDFSNASGLESGEFVVLLPIAEDCRVQGGVGVGNVVVVVQSGSDASGAARSSTICPCRVNLPRMLDYSRIEVRIGLEPGERTWMPTLLPQPEV
jgi:hypothetical protein